MAVPALPSDDSDGNDWTAAKVNAVYDHLEFHRDNTPMIKVSVTHSQGGGAGSAVSTGTNTEVEFSDGAGAFNTTPVINVGGFTAGTTGDKGVYVPETGVYQISAAGQFDASSDATLRRIKILDESVALSGGVAAVPAMNSASLDTFIHAVTFHYFTSGEELGLEGYQNSGGDLDCTFWIEARWVGSSVS